MARYLKPKKILYINIIILNCIISIIFSINHFYYELFNNGEKHPSQIIRAQKDIFKLLVVSDHQSKTQFTVI